MGNFTCAAVNDLFARESGRYNIDIHEKRIMGDPWARLTKTVPFPQGMGTTLKDLTVSRILSASFEDDWALVATSNNDLANGCVPSPSDLSFGSSEYEWSLRTKSYRTPCICLDDLKTSFAIKQQIQKTVSTLTRATTWISSNRARQEYARIVPKYSARPGAIFTGLNSVAQETIPAALVVPSSQLTQDMLDKHRIQLLRDGAWSGAQGGESGQILNLVCDSELSDFLIKSSDAARQDLRFANPSELVKPLGVERSYRGWYHVIDNYLPRFNFVQGLADPWVKVSPFKQVSSAPEVRGYDWVPEPLYESAGFGIAFAHHMDVYYRAVQQVGPDIPDAPFIDFPFYYDGEIFWSNIISDNNPLGKIGRWLMVFQNASEPVHPEYGRAFVYKRCPNDVSFTGCTSP